jgi:signal transduction histidine kinase
MPQLPPRSPGRSVRWHLVVFAAALALPILAFIGFLLWQYATSERDRLEREASSLARAVATAIDRELAGLSATLDVLSLSPYLKSGDLRAFYDQAKQVEDRQGVISVLRDLSGQQLVNTRRAFGTPLPVVNLPIDKEVLASRRLEVSGLFTGAVANQPLFAIVIPVLRDGEPIDLLSLSLDVARLDTIIAQEQPPPSWTVAVVDKAGLIMARSHRGEEFVGKPAAQDFLDKSRARSGTWTGTAVDGAQVFTAYARSALADWRIGVAVRQADLNAPLWRSLLLFGAIGAVLVVVSVLIALFYGRRIAGPMLALNAQATAVGRGEVTPPLQSGIREVDEVSVELQGSAARLLEREVELRESNEEIQRFAYIVSHDLRAPLVNIMGFTSELEALRGDLIGSAEDEVPAEKRQLAADFDESIGFIKAGIAKMDGLIGAILKISREGRRAFRADRLDMTSLVRGLADAIRYQADEVGATVTVKDLPPIVSDRLAIEQVFGNLLDNAVKYLDDKRPGRIEISGREEAGRVVYSVRDNGRGIAEQDLGRVFELFRRAGVQNRPGEGIGLAHVRTLVRALGGRIDLASQAGVGTTFTVTLPKRLRNLSSTS